MDGLSKGSKTVRVGTSQYSMGQKSERSGLGRVNQRKTYVHFSKLFYHIKVLLLTVMPKAILLK